jgi:hypothetical protein
MERAPAFLTYYIFSSSITHVATLSALSQDVQAQIGLRQNMMALKAMEIVWPSAGRAWELLNGCAVIGVQGVPSPQPCERQTRKRAAEEVLEPAFSPQSNNEFFPTAPGAFHTSATRHSSTRHTHHMRTQSHPSMSMSNSPLGQEPRPQHTYQQSLPCSLSPFTFPARATTQNPPAASNTSTPKLWTGFGAPTHTFLDPSTFPSYYGLTPSFQALGATTLDQNIQDQFYAPEYSSYETNTRVS